MHKLILLLISIGFFITDQAQDLRLWYDKPAQKWTDALPLGNGRLGAMVFGGTSIEHVQFNEESLWTGGPRNYNRPGARDHLAEIRSLIAKGEQAKADALAEKYFMGLKSSEGDRKAWVDKMFSFSEASGILFNDASWKTIPVPSFDGWEAVGLIGVDGCVWLRKEINWKDNTPTDSLVLDANRIRDADRTFINGVLIGTQSDNEARLYSIPKGLLKPGKNIIAIQILNFADKGGLTGYKDTSRHIGIRFKNSSSLLLDIQGQWKYWIQNDSPPEVPKYQADYQPFGDLYISTGHKRVTRYKRSLDLRNAEHKVQYVADDIQYTRRSFISAVDQVMVISMEASKLASINQEIWMDALHKGYVFDQIDDSTFRLQVQVRHGALFGRSLIRIRQTGGTRSFKDGRIKIEQASKLILFLTAATNFKHFDDVSGDPEQMCRKQLAAITKKTVFAIEQDHRTEYKKKFERFTIHFGFTPQESKPTDQRIDEFANTDDPSLLALYAQYGRYLLISSSRPGTMPANLQGIWNDQINPPWGSKYTTNINAEMNYWPAELLNLSDHHQTLFTMIEELAMRGKETAWEYYGARGWVLHHNTDLWRGTAPINAANHGIWQTGGAWLSHHLWEHFLFTQDTGFLKKYYPIIRDAAIFFMDAMIRDVKTGWYITSPSNSPEQGGLVQGPSMDHQIIRSLFKAVIQAGGMLKLDHALIDSMKIRLNAIAPDQIGKYGQLQEWMVDVDDPSNRHRHVSHLWAVFPGKEISWETDPAFMQAAKQSLLFRRDAATGWSLGWKINLWARFKDGDHVFKLLKMLLSPAEKFGAGSYPNLFDAHPPFQIDGNFGGAAGIMEMLIQSHDGYIDLLPALPDALPFGKIEGVRARGGAELSFHWKDKQLQYLDIRSSIGGDYLINYKTLKQVVRIKPGEKIRLNKDLQEVRYSIVETRLDHQLAPLGVQSDKPVFSWRLISNQKQTTQAFYQIQIARTADELIKGKYIWDSGKKRSVVSRGVSYAGAHLSSNTYYFWRVQSWDNVGRNSGWSTIDSFHTGIYTVQDWQNASWIAMQAPDTAIKILPMEHGKGKIKKNGELPILPIFRKTFELSKNIKRATAHITGLGQYEMYVNGKKVGDHFLDPGWTAFDKEVLYQTFDVTPLIKKGENAIGVMIGNGMYHIPGSRYRKFTGSFGYPKMICLLTIEYTDGTKAHIVSDRSWKCQSSPITYSSIFGGEDMNANNWENNWNNVGFDDTKWRGVVIVHQSSKLIHQYFPSVKWMDTFTVRSSKHLSKRTDLFDMGQNASGIPYVKLRGQKGDTIRIWTGELLNEDGTVNQKATGSPTFFQYILKGDQQEEWWPRFSYSGFRYLQIDKLPVNQQADIHIIEVKAFHTYASVDRIGYFTSSNELFNRIDSLINWAIQSNTQSISTDCPHREKIGWLEQVHLMGNSIRYTYDIQLLFRKILMDIRSAQTSEGVVPTYAPEYVFMRSPGDPFGESPEWGSTLILTAWDLYKWYGDRSVLMENYESMKKYISYLHTRKEEGLLYFGLGDWYDVGPGRPGFSQLTPKGLTASAIFFYDLSMMVKIADLLGFKDDAKRYAEEASALQQKFQNKFYSAETGSYGSGSQTSNAMSYVTGIARAENRPKVLQNLIDSIVYNDYKITAGDIGFRYLITALVEAGRSDVLYKMNNRDDVPGYGYQLSKGATALTESWQALPSVSNNHLMLGHIKEWFYGGLGGLKEIFFEKDIPVVEIHPLVLKDIQSVSVQHKIIEGDIAVSWHWEDDFIYYDIDIPVNVKARVTLLDGTVRKLGSGEHYFAVNSRK